MEKEDVKDILRRLANLEEHLINLIYPIQEVNAVLKNPDMVRKLISLLSKPLNVDDRRLITLVQDFKITMDRFQKDSANLDVGQTYGEIKFIGKRLHQIEATLEEMKKEGIKKKIQLDVSCDGYEMVKRRKVECIDEIKQVKDPDEYLQELLNTLTDREQKVLIHRLGLLGEKKKTYDAIGKVLGTGRERIRQIYAKALRKCRHPDRKKYVDNLTHKELRKEITADNE